MARLNRWSRATARDRWNEVDDLVRRPLALGVACLAMWPLTVLVVNLSAYRDPLVAAGILALSVAVPLELCRRGPHGVGPVASAVAGAVAVASTVLLGAQLDAPFPDAAHFMNSWAAAAAVILGFSRPVEEPLLIMSGIFVANVAVTPVPGRQALHTLPLAVGAPVPVTVCLVAVAVLLRTGRRTVRRAREVAAQAERRRAVAAQRRVAFARWESAVAPLLEDLAAGRRDPADESVTRECRGLAQDLRAALSARPASLFDALLADETARLRERGGELVVEDVDAGTRLAERDRVAVAELVREVCAGSAEGSVRLTLLVEDPGHVLAVLAVDGAPLPDGPAWRAAGGATLTTESATRWWWDARLPAVTSAAGSRPRPRAGTATPSSTPPVPGAGTSPGSGPRST